MTYLCLINASFSGLTYKAFLMVERYLITNDCTYYLTGTDLQGYNFEMVSLDKLEVEGFGNFITYHNPVDQYEWKCTREKGIDARIVMYEYSFDIEFSWMSSDYWYRQQWFTDSRKPRFRNSQESNRYHFNIIVTNRPHNYDPVRYLAQQSCGGIFIMSLAQLIELLRSILSMHQSIINKVDGPHTTNNRKHKQFTNNQRVCIHIFFPYALSNYTFKGGGGAGFFPNIYAFFQALQNTGQKLKAKKQYYA